MWLSAAAQVAKVLLWQQAAAEWCWMVAALPTTQRRAAVQGCLQTELPFWW
jgi:hypothetical protein